MRRALVRSLLTATATVVVALAAADASHAAVSPTCAGTVATLAVTTNTAHTIETKTGAGEVDKIYVDSVLVLTCAGLTQIDITGDGADNVIAYQGGQPVIVHADLGGGNDTFTTMSSLPVGPINGDAGDDQLTGGSGSDTLNGGPGNGRSRQRWRSRVTPSTADRVATRSTTTRRRATP